ncbi:MAG: hypothetical protein IT432_05160 [Phycisphaerales bacterium]|nr:hypothetical protein [Phycisphaerales bacterium]
MKKISMICLAAGLACTATAVAKPPVQVADLGAHIKPEFAAQARLVNGKVVKVGEWISLDSTVSTRGAMGVYASFDCFGLYMSDLSYMNFYNGGYGSSYADPRSPGADQNTGGCGIGGSRYYFGTTYNNPIQVDDVQSNTCFDFGGGNIDGYDWGFFWGGSTRACLMAVFTSNDDMSCANVSDPLANNYNSGVIFGWSALPPSAPYYYHASFEGVFSTNGIVCPSAAPGGSYLWMIGNEYDDVNNIFYYDSTDGTQLMLWGTGEDTGEAYRAGTQGPDGWDDDAPTSGAFESGECYDNSWGGCPFEAGKTVTFLTLRCPADVDNNGFVNALDYDAFASAFEAGDTCADFDGNGFTNALDYDAFASSFESGC